MAKFLTLCSSSSGNCTYIGTENGAILIDAGESCKQLCLALSRYNINPETINGIFVTHEHSDHTKAVRVFARKYDIDVYATHGTMNEMLSKGLLDENNRLNYIDDNGVQIDDLFIKKFKTSHDTAEPCGYTVEIDDDTKIGICTDTGFVTDDAKNAIRGSDLVLLESNHDVYMLRHGIYPPHLQNRILSNFGHLSNDACAETAKQLVSSGTSKLILGHLSEHNNTPRLAYETTMNALQNMGAVPGKDFNLEVASPLLSEHMVIL